MSFPLSTAKVAREPSTESAAASAAAADGKDAGGSGSGEKPKNAFVTLIMLGDSFICGALVLGWSIRKGTVPVHRE